MEYCVVLKIKSVILNFRDEPGGCCLIGAEKRDILG